MYPDRKKGSRYMLRVLVAACALLVPALARPYAPASAATVSVDGLTLGQLEVVMPDGEPQGLVFLFSDEPGPTAEFASAAEKLAGLDLMVAPVALRPFLDRQDAQGEGDKCLYLVSDIEEASRRVQAAGARGRYLTPIIAGTGMGAAVAYAALAQAPDATVAGAASDGFTTRVATKLPLCEGAPAKPAAAGGFEYGPAPLPGWWKVGASADQAQAAASFATEAGATDAVVAQSGGTLGDRLAALLEGPLTAAAEETLAGLPLVALPVKEPGRLMAVIYSGDGGWRDIDKDIAGALQAKGIPVVGVDSLRYFWSEKTPDQVAADLSTIIGHYTEAWQRPDVVLIGYSFGAAVLPFAYNRLADDDRAQVKRLSLLGISDSADFVIHVTGWLGVNSHEGSVPTRPEVARLPLGQVQCFYGEEEEDTICPLPLLKGAQIVKTAGGHHFDGDYHKLADLIVADLKR
jgi:type IV secretory pathway VirJ component